MAQFVEVQCCNCGVLFGVEANRHATLRRTGTSFHCTNGCSQSYRETEADRLRRERDRLQQQLACKDDEIQTLRNQSIAAKGQITKLKRRAKNGTCPCCKRTFSNMQEHMKNQHPEFDPNVVDLGSEKKKRAKM